MNGRNDKQIVRDIDKLSEKELLTVSGGNISEILPRQLSKFPENLSNDELIAALSDKRENRRARQVFEWEKVRRINNFKAA